MRSKWSSRWLLKISTAYLAYGRIPTSWWKSTRLLVICERFSNYQLMSEHLLDLIAIRLMASFMWLKRLEMEQSISIKSTRLTNQQLKPNQSQAQVMGLWKASGSRMTAIFTPMMSAPLFRRERCILSTGQLPPHKHSAHREHPAFWVATTMPCGMSSGPATSGTARFISSASQTPRSNGHPIPRGQQALMGISTTWM